MRGSVPNVRAPLRPRPPLRLPSGGAGGILAGMPDLRASLREHLRHAGRDFLHYSICGIGAVAADYAAFGLLNRGAGWGAVAAQLVSRPTGGVVSFLANRFWTFRHRQGAALPIQFARYAAVWIVAYALSVAAIWGYLRILPGWPFAAKVLADGTVMIVTFLANRHWTFRATPRI